MSRLGKKPIVLPKGVEVKVSGNKVEVKGPKGTLINEVPEGIKVEVIDQMLQLSVPNEELQTNAMLGLHRAILSNAVDGVLKGFEKKLTLVGVGYRATLKGSSLDLQLGFSHPCEIKVPTNLHVAIDKSTTITITGVDKRLVGHFAAAVRSVKPPEPYKGKGIRYVDEFVRKKAGKTAKGK